MIWTRRGFWPSVAIFATEMLIVASASAQQGAGVLTGRVEDATTRAPVADVVVTVTGAALQGEQIAVTDASGLFRIPNLPPGEYTVRYEKETFRPSQRSNIALRADVTLRIDAQLLPEAIKGEEVVVVAQAPTVDVGSSSQGLNITNDFTSHVPVILPGSRGGAVRSFEAVAEVVPGAKSDQYGTSINGSTSPENSYVIDGISQGSGGYGTNATPLSVEFVKEVNVISGGYMPEYGRATGGILNAVTEQGSNEFHGGVWLNVNPGGLEGDRTQVRRSGTAIETNRKLNNIADFGFKVGGPLIKDKLWFFVGGQLAQTSYYLNRQLNYFEIDPATGAPTQDENGFDIAKPITDGTGFRRYTAERIDGQAFGKLTWTVNSQNRVNFTVYTTPYTSGGGGKYQLGNQSLLPPTQLAGAYSALANKNTGHVINMNLNWTTETADKKVLVDTRVAYQLQGLNSFASDGSSVTGRTGLASVPGIQYQRNPGYHPITDFEPGVGPGICEAPGTAAAVVCPASTYAGGGPGFLAESTTHRVQARSTATFLAEALGHHVAKAGIDFEYLQYQSVRGNSGGTAYQEGDFATASNFDLISDNRNYHYTVRPDQFVNVPYLKWTTQSFIIGGFVQDSWSILDKVTLNVGLRWDGQFLFGGDGKPAMNLPKQWSPRVGLIWDPTEKGNSKVYANYARYYTTIPLNLMDRAGSLEPGALAERPVASCNPLDPAQAAGSCRDQSTYTTFNDPRADRRYRRQGTGLTPISNDLEPTAQDEFVAGGELDVIKNGRVGVFYTKRWLGRAIEDISRDETATYFIANPGYGPASDFPKPTRDYDGFTVFFQKAFADGWIAQANYTLSYLRGNYEGLFKSDTGQLDPFITSLFDLPQLVTNKSGPLGADRTHEIKLFGAKDFEIPGNMLLQVGGSFRATSGGPTNYRAAHPLYGADEIFLLQAGEGNRLPWVYRFDLRVGYAFKLGREQSVSLSADIFNLFNFQAVTTRDETYTSQSVQPIENGTRAVLDRTDGTSPFTKFDDTPLSAAEVNRNFGQPTQYQEPRQFRFGIRTTF